MTAALFRYVPALDSLRGYRLADLRADTLAGLTVAAVAVPQAMAYAMVAGLPPQYGLYTAIVMTAVGAVLDSSKQLINGPTNAISIAVLSALSVVQSPDEKVNAAILLALLVGSFQLVITLLRLGDLTRYISHSVIVGFTAGAGSLLVLDQIKNLFGFAPQGDVHDHFLSRWFATLTQGGPIHLPTLMVGLGAIAGVLGLRALKKRLGWVLLPELLLVVVGAAAVTGLLGLADLGVKIVGHIPAELPRPSLPHADEQLLRSLSGSALAIATLGLLEAVAMAKAIAAQTRQKLDINQQCLSEGLANFTGGFFQCIPGSGSLTRSAINQQAGARTQWSGVISAAAVAGIMLAFAPYARFIPRAALAGILIVSAFRMVDWGALRFHWRATRFDKVIVGVTALSAVAISVEFCVLIGVFLSFLLAVPRAGRMSRTEFVVSDDGIVHERLPEDQPCGAVRVYGLDGEMFFGSVASLERHLEEIEAAAEGAQQVVLRMKRVRNPDASGLHQLDHFLHRMAAKGIRVTLAGVRRDLHHALLSTETASQLAADQLFVEQPQRFTSAMQALRQVYAASAGHCSACAQRAAALAARGG